MMTMKDKRRALNALLANSLMAFAERALATFQTEPLVFGLHLYAIAYALERVERGEIRRLAIAAPPRSLKSFLASAAFPAWVLGRNPRRRIVTASYSLDLAHSFALQTLRIVKEPWFHNVFPGVWLDPQRASVDEMRTLQGGYRITTSVGGTLTGKGGNIFIIDDPLKAGEADSEAARAAAREWFKTTVASRLDNPAKDAIVLVQQRLHVDDLFGLVQELGGWTLLELPAIWTKSEVIPIEDSLEWLPKPGNLLEPDRIGEDDLARLKKEMGTANFQAQYQQQPESPAGNLVKMEWFGRYDQAPSPDAFEAIVQSWDTAMVPGEGNDYSVCTTWGILGMRLYLLHVFRAQLNYPDLHKELNALRDRYAAVFVVVEKMGSGVSLCQDLRQGGAQWIAPLGPEGGKISRLPHESAKIEAGMVLLPKNAPWLKAFEAEVAQFPHGRHDDQVDSMSQFLRALDFRPYILHRLSMYAGRR